MCSAHQCARARGCIFDDEVICNLFPWVWSIIYKIHHHLYSWFVLVWLAFAQCLLFSGLQRPLLQMYNGAFCQKIVHKMHCFCFPNKIRKRVASLLWLINKIFPNLSKNVAWRLKIKGFLLVCIKERYFSIRQDFCRFFTPFNLFYIHRI